ncbi:MAG: hypothetical protein P8Y58_05585 [Novosphingobium sp.]
MNIGLAMAAVSSMAPLRGWCIRAIRFRRISPVSPVEAGNLLSCFRLGRMTGIKTEITETNQKGFQHMRIGKLLAAVAASSLIATPVMANSAAPLSLAKAADVKVSTSSSKTNKQFLGSNTLLVLLGIGVVAGGIAIAASSGSDSP